MIQVNSHWWSCQVAAARSTAAVADSPDWFEGEEPNHPRWMGGDGWARLAEAPQSPRLWTHGLPRPFPRASVLPGVALSRPRGEHRMVVDRAAGMAIRTQNGPHRGCQAVGVLGGCSRTIAGP